MTPNKLEPGDLVRFHLHGMLHEGRVTRTGNGIVYVKLPDGRRHWLAMETTKPITHSPRTHA